MAPRKFLVEEQIERFPACIPTKPLASPLRSVPPGYMRLAVDFQHTGMKTRARGNPFELLVRLKAVAKLNPALGG
jgi:hypothetical protein